MSGRQSTLNMLATTPSPTIHDRADNIPSNDNLSSSTARYTPLERQFSRCEVIQYDDIADQLKDTEKQESPFKLKNVRNTAHQAIG